MNDIVVLALVACLLVEMVVVMRITAGARQRRELARLEAKVDALLKHQGVEFNPTAEVPPSVVEALQGGRKIDAIKEYRMATGVGLKEAKEFVEQLQDRMAQRT